MVDQMHAFAPVNEPPVPSPQSPVPVPIPSTLNAGPGRVHSCSVMSVALTDPPGPKLSLIAQLVYRPGFGNPLEFFTRIARTYGDIVSYRMGGEHLFLVNDWQHIREILVTNNRNFTKSRGLERSKRLLGRGLLTSEGAFHLRQRRLMQPAFHRERIAGYGQTMVEYADRMRNAWTDGATLDLAREMNRLTLSIVGKTLFDADVEAKVHEEIDRVLKGRLPTTGDLWLLPYVERVVTESMRLYPPAWIIGRRAIADYPLGPYIAPAQSILIMSPYIIQRDPRYYSEPERFNPDRWTPEFRAALPKFVYFPFGGGPRQCIGESFAWMELVLLVATIAQRWQLRLVPGHPVVPQPLVTLRAKHGMKMTVHERRAPLLAAERRAPLDGGT